eukprot:scaffold119933_cov29-Attheya_sp.AAC.2
MISNKLTYEDICDTAVEEYHKLIRNSEWQPVKHSKDVKVPTKTFGNVLTNINENSSKFGKQGLCHNCNKPGHWARECPSKKNGSFRSRPVNRSNRGRGFDHNRSNSNQNTSSASNSWRRTKPADGEPQEITRNGKTFHWCDHCKRFSTTHGTATHTGGKPEDPQANCLFADPSAWHVTISPAEPQIDFPSLLLVLVVVLSSFGFLFFAWSALYETIVALWSIPLAHLGLIGCDILLIPALTNHVGGVALVPPSRASTVHVHVPQAFETTVFAASTPFVFVKPTNSSPSLPPSTSRSLLNFCPSFFAVSTVSAT